MGNIPENITALCGRPIILSLFDWTMSWSNEYARAGYRVMPVDLKWGIDILSWNYKKIPKNLVVGILMAPECTHYTASCNRLWETKDNDGRTAGANALIEKGFELVEWFSPEFWAMENPKGRLRRMLKGNYLESEPRINIPESLSESVKDIRYSFDPCDHGDPWKKKTNLWGVFNIPNRNEVAPIKYSRQGSWTQLLGGKSERTKELRSVTPPGFSKAFFEANNPLNL